MYVVYEELLACRRLYDLYQGASGARHMFTAAYIFGYELTNGFRMDKVVAPPTCTPDSVG